MKSKWDLSKELGKENSLKRIIKITSNIPNFYKTYFIPKRNGDKREIDQPNKLLLELQRKILKNIIYSYPSHPNAKGFVRTRSILDNAKAHQHKKIILKIDFKDYFKNISESKIYSLFFGEYDVEASSFLTKLVTYEGRLPQGAPTSPYLANLVTYNLDKRLTNLCKKNKLEYTRYADDIAISGCRIKKSLTNKIFSIIEEEGFIINKKKVRFISQKVKQKITGLVVNNGISVGRAYYRKLRMILYKCYKEGIESQMEICEREGFYQSGKNFMNFLKGHIHYVSSINKNQGSKLMNQFKKIDWGIYLPPASSLKQYEMITQNLDLLNSIHFLTTKNNRKIVITELTKLYKQCKTEIEFVGKCQILDNLFKNMDISFFEKKIKDSKKIINNDGTKMLAGKIINCWLSEASETEIKIFNDVNLFSKQGFRHQGSDLSRDYFRALIGYKQRGFTSQYEGLWSLVLTNIRKDLSGLLEAIKKNN